MLSRADVLPLNHALSYVECDLLEDETLSEYRRRLERERTSWHARPMRKRLGDVDIVGVLVLTVGISVMLVIPTILILVFIVTGWTL